MCTGFGAVQAFSLPEICETLAAAGYITLRFDYRGFRESEGARGRLIPMDHVSGLTHYDVYTSEGFAAVMRETLAWFRTFIPAS